MINQETVYAACCCLSMHSLHQTREEAELEASQFEQQVGNSVQSGYVLKLAPGSLNDEMYQGAEGTHDYIQYDCFNQFQRPTWLKMTYRPGEKKIPTPSRLVGYAHREW